MELSFGFTQEGGEWRISSAPNGTVLASAIFDRLFAQRSLAPKVAARAETMDLVRGYVGGGLGYSLISARPANRAALNGGRRSISKRKPDFLPAVGPRIADGGL